MDKSLYELIPHPETIGQRLVKVLPRQPLRSTQRIDLDDLLGIFWENETELRSVGWLDETYVEVNISKLKEKTLVEIWEVEK